MYNKIYLALIIFVFTSIVATAQNNNIKEKIDSQFHSALQKFDDEDYDNALSEFEKIINNYPLNSKTTAAYFFKIKILVEKNEYERAVNAINYFIETYPSSRYIDEIRMLRVKLHLENHEYSDAYKELAFIIDKTNSIAYRIEAKNLAGKIAENYLTSSGLQKTADLFTGENVRPFLLLQAGKAYLREGNKQQALLAFSKVFSRYPNSVEYSEAKNLYDNPEMPETTASRQVLIAVLLPLNLDYNNKPTTKAAGEILAGIKFAVSKFNEGRDDKIGIVVYDTKAEEDKIDEIRSEVGNNYNFKAIIGPIFSDEVRSTLKAFEDTDIPIISPTATDDDLTGVNENFFQGNPPLAIRGKIMAQYVFFVENKRRIAVLNSIDGYSPLLAATFSDEFTRLGGQIIAKETYKNNSLSFAAPVEHFISLPDLEGIYVPLSGKTDAPAILSQMVQDSLYVPLYGNQDWFFAKGFESSPQLSNMLTFSSDFFIEFNNPDFKTFSNEYQQTSGKDASRNVLYGYDTAKYLLTVMRNVDKNREAIRNKMMSGLTSRGYHNNISFDEKRINRFLNIVRYKDGLFRLIEKFRAGSL